MHALVLAAMLAASTPVEVLDRWDGMVADEAEKTVVAPADFIAEGKTFSTLWKAWRPNEPVPNVDFARDLVLVGIVPGPNRVLLQPTVDEGGNVSFIVGGTKRAGPGFGYALVRIRRLGITAVNGTRVAAVREVDDIDVKLVGVVRTGIVAVGGETTGVTITVDGSTYELDARGDAKLAGLFKQFDGKRAVVEGRLTTKPGIEGPNRRIIGVTRIDSSEK